MFTREELIGWAEDLHPLETVSVERYRRNSNQNTLVNTRSMQARYESASVTLNAALNISLDTQLGQFTFHVPLDGSCTFADLPLVGWEIVRPDGSRWVVKGFGRVVLDVLKVCICSLVPPRTQA